MKHLQPKTLHVMLAILTSVRFSQTGIWKLCNSGDRVSIGQVNKVVTDLVRKGFVERSREELGVPNLRMSVEMGRAGFLLSDPVGLLRYISLFRVMRDLRALMLSVDASEDDVIDELSKRGAIFCLGTAQERYAPYYRPDEISFYSQMPEELHAFLRSARKGSTRVGCYRMDLRRAKDESWMGPRPSLFAAETDGIMMTTKVQTVMDMFCDGKGVYAKPLLRELWGVEI